MPHALNLTARLKQDPQAKAKLEGLKQTFATHVQPAIEAALAKSKLVHFARVLVIDDLYIQVLTEFDGGKRAYTDFFLEALPDVFHAVFDLVEGAPPWEELKNPDRFYEFTRHANLRALGTKADDPESGYLFAAYPQTVQQIVAKFAS